MDHNASMCVLKTVKYLNSRLHLEIWKVSFLLHMLIGHGLLMLVLFVSGPILCSKMWITMQVCVYVT